MSDEPTAVIPFEECEQWMREVGFVSTGGKPNWPALLIAADIPVGQQYVVKDRWGTNPKQSAKVFAALRQKESKLGTQTPWSKKLRVLEEWDRLRKELEGVTARSALWSSFSAPLGEIEGAISEAKSLAVAEAEADRHRRALASAFSEPRNSRK